MRRGELLGLKWPDIDWERSKISIVQTLTINSEGISLKQATKTKSSRRSIAISDKVKEVLNTHQSRQKNELKILGTHNKDKLVFTSTNGTAINPSNLDRQFTSLITKNELPELSIHGLRHTHATLLLKAGVHPKIVQERLGHASIKITLDLYSHVLPDMQEEAAVAVDHLLEKTAINMERKNTLAALGFSRFLQKFAFLTQRSHTGYFVPDSTAD